MNQVSYLFGLIHCSKQYTPAVPAHRVEVRHGLVPVDAVHVAVVLGVEEGLELLLRQLQVLVPVRHGPAPPVPQLQLLELLEGVGVHVVLQHPPGGSTVTPVSTSAANRR